MDEEDYKAIDISLNYHAPDTSFRLLPLGLYKAAGPTWVDKIRKGWTHDVVVDMMDRGNVELALVISLWCANGVGGEEIYVDGEEMLGLIERYPGRFAGLLGLSPLRAYEDKYYPPRYLDRMVREHGFKGAHMYPHWFGIRIDDRRMYPIYEKCAELDIPISFQTGQGTMRSGSRVVARPLWIDAVLADFPSLRVIALHSGYPWEDELVALALDYQNLFICPDVPPPRLWHSAIVSYLKEEGQFAGSGGSDKVLWSTDWPLQEPGPSLH